MKYLFIFGLIICMIFVFTSGCMTGCIPVEPTQVISSSNYGSCVAIIDNTSFVVANSGDCSRIIPNQTNKLFFDGDAFIGPDSSIDIEGVCSP